MSHLQLEKVYECFPAGRQYGSFVKVQTFSHTGLPLGKGI